MRNLFKYSKFYSGQDPQLQEGDVFRIIVPLDEEYSFDYALNNKNIIKTTGKTTGKTTSKTTGKTTGKPLLELSETEEKIISIVQEIRLFGRWSWLNKSGYQ